MDIRDGTDAAPCDGHFGTAAERASADCADILAAKRLAFRYALFAHSMSENTGSSGRADDTPGDDFVVTLQTWSNASMIRNGGGAAVCGGASACRRRGEAATFMHELGHTIGLRHGGGDDQQYKPNYLSVMNYLFQFPSVVPSRPLTYSNWLLPTLSEATLDETKGIDGAVAQAGLPADWTQTAFSYLAVDGKCHMRVTGTTGPINWDLDANPGETSVQRGINNPHWALVQAGNDAGDCDLPAFQMNVLPGFSDWPSLVYSPRSSDGYLGAGTFPSGAGQDPELTLAEVTTAVESTDADGDGVMNATDNCSAVANADQADADGDEIGDACDPDGPGPGPGPVPVPVPADRVTRRAAPADQDQTRSPPP